MHRFTLSPIRRMHRPRRTLGFPSSPAGSPARAQQEGVPTTPVSVTSMNSRTRKTLGAIGAISLAFAVSATSIASPADAAPPLSPAQQRDPILARGRYLVEHVGLCADCHSPRNEKGEFLRDRWLLGSPIPLQPTVPMPWAPAAPPIAGLPTMTEAQALHFLQHGKRPDGTEPRPPMPPYRFNAKDASAVVAYLKSLAPKPTLAAR